MLKEEYERLIVLLEEGTIEGKVQLEEILKEAVLFFETLRSEYPEASKEKREEILQMMATLHAKLQEISKTAAQVSGMTEDELAAFAENPGNFTAEQWQTVQATKRQLYDSARKFSASMESKKRASGQNAPAEKPKPIRPKTRRSTRKDWTKS